MAFHFKRLPCEVRHKIYQYLAPSNTNLVLDRHVGNQTVQVQGQGHNDDEDATDIIALFSTCRTIYAEASPTLYLNNTVVVRYLSTLLQLRKSILPSITSLEVHLSAIVRSRDMTLMRPGNYARPAAHDLLVPGWQAAIDRVFPRLRLGSLDLRVIVATDRLYTGALDPMDFAMVLVTPLHQQLRLKGCHFQLEDRGRLVRLLSQQQTIAQQAFRFGDLPTEIRIKILKYTDLITPCKAVRWSPRGYTPFITKAGSELYGCKWPSRDNTFTCEGYYIPDAPPSTQSWEKPTALFLVSRAFYSECRDVFFAYNRFEITSGRDALARQRTGISGTSRARQFLDSVSTFTLPSLRYLDIRHEFLFFRANEQLCGDVCWQHTIESRKEALNLQQLSFRVDLQELPASVANALQPGFVTAEDSLPPISKMVSKYLWPLSTVGRKPGVEKLVIRITSPGIHGYYYLRRPSLELPEKFQNKLMSAESHIVRLVAFTQDNCLSGIPYSLDKNRDGSFEIRDVTRFSEIYKDAMVEGFWFWRSEETHWDVGDLGESLGPYLSSMLGVFGA
ncbi:hypothetical protein F4820DRAFT_245294 [Hypoxylon rubiginosum]|uniref:Uncharacterized protein n=1 Tax=Hypoxylon rubiginosum TaxID=110542 RepID=A0ACB9Z4I4_9PEZI|nr:hypothetical protein F4820DRAFT_245294 [Hypoxylon rubiginosum]